MSSGRGQPPAQWSRLRATSGRGLKFSGAASETRQRHTAPPKNKFPSHTLPGPTQLAKPSAEPPISQDRPTGPGSFPAQHTRSICRDAGLPPLVPIRGPASLWERDISSLPRSGCIPRTRSLACSAAQHRHQQCERLNSARLLGSAFEPTNNSGSVGSL